MKHIFLSCIFIFLSIYGPACSEDNSYCTDCGGGLIDGYIIMEVTAEDVANTNLDTKGIGLSDVGKCIRVKKDGTDFEDVAIVNDCCCIEFQ